MIETPAQILEHEASTDAVRSFIAWRKATKKPLTERAACMIAKSLREITGKGGDADEALDLAQEHGWQTIKPDWYWRVKNGNGNSAAKGGGTYTRDEQASIAAGFARAPRDDCF